MSLKGKAAIVGVGEVKPSEETTGLTEMGLMAQVAAMAIEDAGLRKEDIDGILCETTGPGSNGLPSLFAEYLQIQPRYASTVGLLGANGAGMVWRAAAAIDGGLCNYVVCAGAAVQNSILLRQRIGGRQGGPGSEFEAPYGSMGANSGYALIAQRHSFEFGTTSAQRARIAVDQRFNACANPNAVFYGQPITTDDVLNSRIVVSPLHLLEIVMPCTGAVAYVVTSPERARALRHPPVYLLGAGECVSHSSVTYHPWMTTSPIKIAAAHAFKMAGVSPREINMVSAYDCYTITVLITLEDAGFCKKGEGGSFVESTDMTYKGKLPLNTHGGQLSWGQPGVAGGMSHIVDATVQLMGRAGERQVPNCELAFVSGNGGIMSENVALILGRHPS